MLLSTEFYERRLKDLFGRWALVWLLKQPSIAESVMAAAIESRGGTHDIRVGSKEEETPLTPTRAAATGGDIADSASAIHDLVFAFITGATDESEEEAREMVKTSFNEEATQLLNLSHGWICSFLPHVLSKICRVRFGLLHPEDIERWSRLVRMRCCTAYCVLLIV